MTKEIWFPVVAAVLMEKGGKKIIHAVVEDSFPTATSVVDKWPDLPGAWKEDGKPLHEYLGHDATQVGLSKVIV
jgi:hypothetical protein